MPLYSDQHIIDQKFSEALGNYSVKPSSRVWWRIGHAISIPAKTGTRKFLLFTAGLLLMGSSAGLYESLHHAKASKMKKENIEQSSPLVIQTAAMIPTEIQVETPKKKSIACHKVTQYPKIESSAITVVKETVSENKSSIQLDGLSEMKLSPAKPLNTEIKLPPSSNSPGVDLPGLFGVGSYYLGLTACFNNTWLIDRQAFASENLKYEFTFGASYGMQGGYYFANRWGVQTAWVVNSWQGQDYKNIDLYGRTTALDYMEKSISLTYMNIPLLVQYRVPKYSETLKNAYNINLIFGGQYGRLISYRIDGIKGEINSNQVFNANEFAAVAGLDYDFMTENTVFYTVGIRTSLGTNIFNSNVPNYFEFDKPHNFIIGLHGAVNFGFSK